MNYSILINTCDKFEDCWDPFFKLFSLYWPDYKGKVYLNTEYKDYNFENIDIRSLKVCENHGIPKSSRVTWSQCLRWAIEEIEDDIVLYMQEDYFIKDRVDNATIQKICGKMMQSPDIMCIYLHSHAVEKELEIEDGLSIVKKDGWRLSCQAALWRKQELLDIIRDYESPWEFENFGNKRSIVMGHKYLTIAKNQTGGGIFR